MFYRDIIEVNTKSGLPIDITDHVQKVLDKCDIKEGIMNLFITATTAGLVINENDRMLFEDFRRMYEEIASKDRIYHHPDNGHSHLRASLTSQHLDVPISDGKPLLGQWQRIFLWEFDKRERERKIIVTVSM